MSTMSGTIFRIQIRFRPEQKVPEPSGSRDGSTTLCTDYRVTAKLTTYIKYRGNYRNWGIRLPPHFDYDIFSVVDENYRADFFSGLKRYFFHLLIIHDYGYWYGIALAVCVSADGNWRVVRGICMRVIRSVLYSPFPAIVPKLFICCTELHQVIWNKRGCVSWQVQFNFFMHYNW